MSIHFPTALRELGQGFGYGEGPKWAWNPAQHSLTFSLHG